MLRDGYALRSLMTTGYAIAMTESQEIGPLWGRRIGAVAVDWAACMAISYGFFGGDAMVILGIFAAENLLLVATLGSTLGHRIFGLRVTRDDGVPYVGVPKALGRTALLLILVPAFVTESDGRGMHDSVVGTRIRGIGV